MIWGAFGLFCLALAGAPAVAWILSRLLPAACPACGHIRHRYQCGMPKGVLSSEAACSCAYWDARWEEAA